VLGKSTPKPVPQRGNGSASSPEQKANVWDSNLLRKPMVGPVGPEGYVIECTGVLRWKFVGPGRFEAAPSSLNSCRSCRKQGPDVAIRWDEKAGLRRDAERSQVIDVLKAQEIKETGNEEG
jgi:hypothetical protein